MLLDFLNLPPRFSRDATTPNLIFLKDFQPNPLSTKFHKKIKPFNKLFHNFIILSFLLKEGIPINYSIKHLGPSGNL